MAGFISKYCESVFQFESFWSHVSYEDLVDISIISNTIINPPLLPY